MPTVIARPGGDVSNAWMPDFTAWIRLNDNVTQPTAPSTADATDTVYTSASNVTTSVVVTNPGYPGGAVSREIKLWAYGGTSGSITCEIRHTSGAVLLASGSMTVASAHWFSLTSTTAVPGSLLPGLRMHFKNVSGSSSLYAAYLEITYVTGGGQMIV